MDFQHGIIPSHSLAAWLLGIIGRFMEAVGLERGGVLEQLLYMAAVVFVAFVFARLLKRVVYLALVRLIKVREGSVGHELLHWGTLSKVCRVIPPLILFVTLPFAFEGSHPVRMWMFRLTGVCLMAMSAYAVGAVLDFVFSHYNIHDNKRNLPTKGVLNVTKGLLWIVVVICAVATLSGKSPAYLLTGLGAFAAALMLVFKDSILGFVAGLQMNQNDMIHVGDWISVPGTPADGVVLDMSLSAVKVRNFDNTIVTVPPYTLISTSFRNYRGMKESGARRIQKDLLIDLATVRRIDGADVDRICAPFPRLKDFVAALRSDGATERNDPGLNPVNGTIETNLGLFRAYVSLYLYDNPDISRNQQLIVNISDIDASGVHLQIYCFTATTDWDAFEAIKSAVLEHIISSVGQFGLAIYTSGSLTVDLSGGN